MKKILALVLALVMTLSLLPMTVWAEGTISFGGVNVYTKKSGDILGYEDATTCDGLSTFVNGGGNTSISVPYISGQGKTLFLEATSGLTIASPNGGGLKDSVTLTGPENNIYTLALATSATTRGGVGMDICDANGFVNRLDIEFVAQEPSSEWRTGATLNESTQYVTWPMRDEIYFVNEDTPASFELNVEGKTETFYMMPAMLLEGTAGKAFGSYIDLTDSYNTHEVYYAVDFWTSTNGGKDLSPIEDELRAMINNLVTSASITLIPVEDSNDTWDWGTKFPDYAVGTQLTPNIRDTFGNRIHPVGFKGDLSSLGMWQVKTTVTLTGGKELTTVFRFNVNYKQDFSYDMPAGSTVDDVNTYIANFSTNYPYANPSKAQLSVNLPAGQLNGTITINAETAPATVMIYGNHGSETVLNGSICANNNRTEVFNIRMVGAGRNNAGTENNPNYGIYGSAYGMISGCSFSGYKTAVYSGTNMYRFGIMSSIFYDNHTALYMEILNPNGGGIPFMIGNVYINNQCALELKKFPANVDTATFTVNSNIFIDNQKDINTTDRSFFAPNNAFGTLMSNVNKAVPNTTGKAYAAPYYEVTDACKTAMSDPSALSLSTVENQINNWIGTVKKYPKNWAVPSYGSVDPYIIDVNDIEDGMTISTIDNAAGGTDGVAGIIKLKTN